MTHEVLPSKNLIPNINLKILIKEWADMHVVAAAVREEETALRELAKSELGSMRAHLAKAFQQEGATLVVEHVQEVYNPELERNFSLKHAALLEQRGECQVVTRFHG